MRRNGYIAFVQVFVLSSPSTGVDEWSVVATAIRLRLSHQRFDDEVREGHGLVSEI